MRMLTTMICVVAVIGLFGCGGSSYLSESPGEGDVSSLTFEVAGVVTPQEGSVLTKDIVLSHVTGDANTNSGSSSSDDGMHSCWFDVMSSNDAVVGVDDGTFQTCADPLNCAVCTVVNGDVDADPNCSVSCVVNVIPRPAIDGMSLTIYYGDDVFFWTDAVGSSEGALRIDGVATPSGSHLFDPTTVQFFENGPASLDGIKITNAGVEDLFTADVLGADGFTRIYNISNTELDPSSNNFDSHIPANMAWVRVGVMLEGSIDLSNLQVPDTSETYNGGYMSTNAGMWHDSDNQASTF